MSINRKDGYALMTAVMVQIKILSQQHISFIQAQFTSRLVSSAVKMLANTLLCVKISSKHSETNT